MKTVTYYTTIADLIIMLKKELKRCENMSTNVSELRRIRHKIDTLIKEIE